MPRRSFASGVSAEALARAGVDAPQEPKRSKYGNVRAEYAGRIYASKLEARMAEHLDLMKLGGLVLDWTPQPVFDLGADVSYIADFHVTYAKGQPRVIDSKGVLTDVFRLKRKFFEHLYGPLDVVTRVEDLPTEGR